MRSCMLSLDLRVNSGESGLDTVACRSVVYRAFLPRECNEVGICSLEILFSSCERAWLTMC